MRGLFYLGVMVAMVGCGGGNDGPEYVPRPDAAIDAMIPCQAPEMYTSGALGADVQEATDYPAEGTGEGDAQHQIIFLAALDDADPGDVLYIELYAGFGAFDGTEIKTGTFALTGDDAAYSSCGACVTIGAKVTSDGTVGAYYSARSGVLNLTSVTTRLTGSLQNVMLYRVITEEGNPGDTATFDCETHIGSASFDTELLAPPPP